MGTMLCWKPSLLPGYPQGKSQQLGEVHHRHAIGLGFVRPRNSSGQVGWLVPLGASSWKTSRLNWQSGQTVAITSAPAVGPRSASSESGGVQPPASCPSGCHHSNVSSACRGLPLRHRLPAGGPSRSGCSDRRRWRTGARSDNRNREPPLNLSVAVSPWRQFSLTPNVMEQDVERMSHMYTVFIRLANRA